MSSAACCRCLRPPVLPCLHCLGLRALPLPSPAACLANPSPPLLPRVPQSDGCRAMQLRCHTAREGHLFRKFGWGNRKSLVEDPAAAGLDVRAELLSYYK